MPTIRPHLARVCLLAVVGGLCRCAAAADGAAPAAEEFFEKQVRPLLASRCYECHGPDSKPIKGGLRVDSRSALIQGGDTGPAVVPGKPKDSLLIDAINYGELYQMPPKSKLSAAEIAVLTKWVEMGSPWPREAASQTTTAAPFDLQRRRESHWSWRPVKPQPLPTVKDAAWPRQAADRFILARLEQQGLTPAAPVDRRTLLRRLSFDLIGLPPTPAELDAFVADASPRAVENVVDRLLASPHFGERWARHWLDLVRYAETRGHEFDWDIPNAFEYRDYVIRAFNADVPYNQFVVEHIAGDLVAPPRLHPTEHYNESLLGTGFWYLGEWVHSPVDIRKDETDRMDNMIDVMGKTFLGLTVGCARCHDHKFDAITQRDFYALQGYLQSSCYRQAMFETQEHNQRLAREWEALQERRRPEIVRGMSAAWRDALDKLPARLLAAREAIRAGVAAADGPKVAEIAARHAIPAPLLARWIAYLEQVKNDVHDPFQVWSQAARAAEPTAGATWAHIMQPTMQALRERLAQADAKPPSTSIVVDYASAQPADWMQDGVTFGPGPVRAGQVRLGTDEGQPLAQVFAQGAAASDPFWAGVTLAPGTARDTGRFGAGQRAGRSIRTRTFKIEPGQLFYLVQGAGHAYAAVDSHLMNEGPLHAALGAQWNADPAGRPRWVAHNLRDYVGHRAHVEFSPASGAADFRVLRVVQADREPPNPTLRPNAALLTRWNDAGLASPSTMAAAYQSALREAVEKFAADSLVKDAAAEDLAPLVQWLVAHGDLLDVSGEAIRARTAPAMEKFLSARRELSSRVRNPSRAAVAMWDGSGEDEFLLIRGNPRTVGAVVPRRILEAIGGAAQPATGAGSGRLELARRLVDPANPYAARVIVNRVWQRVFGRGLVASVDNFGVLGDAPSHPELLDALARQFMDDGWSIKRLIRSLVLSSAYGMSSRESPRAKELDPQNVWLSHARVRRLEGEAIRDAILATSGRLDRKMFGPSVPLHLTSFQEGRGRPASGPLDGAGRRSVYLAVRRNFLSPMMLAFDTPIPFNSVGRRNESNVPAQALILLNDPFVIEQAGVWARKSLSDAALDPPNRINALYLQAFARRPEPGETAAGLAFLEQQGRELGLSEKQALTDPRVWTDYCHVLFNVKEFIFVP